MVKENPNVDVSLVETVILEFSYRKDFKFYRAKPNDTTGFSDWTSDLRVYVIDINNLAITGYHAFRPDSGLPDVSRVVLGNFKRASVEIDKRTYDRMNAWLRAPDKYIRE